MQQVVQRAARAVLGDQAHVGRRVAGADEIDHCTANGGQWDKVTLTLWRGERQYGKGWGGLARGAGTSPGRMGQSEE